jgi:hypothetical protein
MLRPFKSSRNRKWTRTSDRRKGNRERKDKEKKKQWKRKRARV